MNAKNNMLYVGARDWNDKLKGLELVREDESAILRIDLRFCLFLTTRVSSLR